MRRSCHNLARDVRNCLGSLRNCSSSIPVAGKWGLIYCDIEGRGIQLSQCSWDALYGCCLAGLFVGLLPWASQVTHSSIPMRYGCSAQARPTWLSHRPVLPGLLLRVFPSSSLCLGAWLLALLGLGNSGVWGCFFSSYPVEGGMWSSSLTIVSCIKGLCSQPSSCPILEWWRNASFCSKLDIVGVHTRVKEYAKGVGSYSL